MGGTHVLTYWFATFVVKSNERSSNIDDERLSADDTAVKTVHVLSRHAQHHLSSALKDRCQKSQINHRIC